MRLEPGVTFAVAPRFHCRPEWGARLRLNGGLTRRGGVWVPHDDWRAPTQAELQVLVGDHTTAAGPGGCALLTVPAQLRLRWWEVAAREEEEPAAGGYEAFVAEVLELLRFKGRPLPAHCAAAAIVSRPQQRSTRLDASGTALAGFGFGSLAGSGGQPPLAVINLGDEGAHLVLLNLVPDALRTRLPAAEDLLAAFAERTPDYPLVCVELAPGEGIWLPSPPPAFDGWTVGKQDLDVILAIDGAP